MSISHKILASVMLPNSIFIETGSRWGDTSMKALEIGASYVHTIEKDKRLWSVARDRLYEKFHGKVRVWLGDSCKILSTILEDLDNQPVIFWLDAHSDVFSPILTELEDICNWNKSCRILIDDMRVFRAGHWNVSVNEILTALPSNAQVSYLSGVELDDILMADIRC